MKNPENKKEWIVDEEAAEVVREIFRLCVEGYGPTRIANILTERKTPSAPPITYWRKAKSLELHSHLTNSHGMGR